MSVFNEEGRYRARISAARIGKAKSGTDQVEFDLELLGIYEEAQGDSDDNLVECKRGRFPNTVWLSLTEATMGTASQPGWVAQTLQYLGFDGNFDNVEQLVGWEGDFLCQYEDSLKGGQRERWSVWRGGTRTAKPVEQKTVRTLKTRFSNLFKTPAAKAAEKPAKKVRAKAEAPVEAEPATHSEEAPSGGTIPF